MENAVQALKMAAAALIFVIAIGTSFYMFGVSKATADAIIGMRDKQSYLEAADLDGVLYTTVSVTEDASGNSSLGTGSTVTSVTPYGDRIVSPDDVIATLYRYAAEKYAVTIINKSDDGKVLARFDSSIESIIQNNSTSIDDTGWQLLAEQIKNNLQNKYIDLGDISLDKTSLKELYKIEYDDGTGRTIYGAPWLGNNKEIQKRVDADISGGDYINTSLKQKYTGKGILNAITATGVTVTEVLNDIDESEYVMHGGEKTGLLSEYQMPTVEVIYIIS